MTYLKTTPYTNAVCCLLNVISLKKNNEFSQNEEIDLWLKTATLPTRASSIFGLALEAKKKDLEVEVIVSNEDFDFPDYRFHRYKKSDIELANISEKIYLNKCKKEKINITIKEISIKEIIELLKTHYLIIRLNTKIIRNLKRNNSNYLLFTNFKDNNFEIIDPSIGVLNVSKELITESYKSLETKKYRNHKLLMIKK